MNQCKQQAPGTIMKKDALPAVDDVCVTIQDGPDDRKDYRLMESDRSSEAPTEVDDDGMVFCPLCLRQVIEDDTFQLRACGHRFCTTCLMASLRDRIDAGERQLLCGYQHATKDFSPCSQGIASEDVNAIVAAETWVKYNEDSQTRKRQLGRATSLVMQRFREGAIQNVIFCQMCFEYVPHNKSIVFKLRACGHLYCRACLEHYLTAKINEGIVRPVCFHAKRASFAPATETSSLLLSHAPDYRGPGKGKREHLCGKTIAREDINLLVSGEAWKRHKANEQRRQPKDIKYECPNCGRLQDCRKAHKQPLVKCLGCKKTFCVMHGMVHVGATCAEYERGIKFQSKLDHARVSKLSKPCPDCKQPVEKTRAQNDMTCLSCQNHFCWLCLTKIADEDDHFVWWNVTGCPISSRTLPDPAMPNGTARDKAKRFAIKYVAGLPFYLIGLVIALPTWPLRLCCRSSRVGFFTHVDDCALSVVYVLWWIAFITACLVAIVLDFFAGFIIII
ncbi:TPA: hypothetical protein N0F65_002907 [Lagenidium giganteum]|uniref:RBR-type E3 ubiquitin transferase n=1 Tax=Lagenidium giganteum TaxID=4803 RepID=A0AAV2Z632_9STRA|nr:TPA: hypothetical protein N0F65_002907 [Lagenidium giganteum]